MLARINYQNFILFMIDYFDEKTLIDMKYVILSAQVKNTSQEGNITSMNPVYPNVDMQCIWRENNYDIDSIKDEYLDIILKTNEANVDIYRKVIGPLIQHENVILVCSDYEDGLLDILVDYLYDEYQVDTVDLNQLFETGELNEIRNKISMITEKTDYVRKLAANENYESLSTTRDGRIKMMDMMTLKEKISLLKDLGAKVSKKDIKNINMLLTDIWVNSDDVVD